MNNLPVAVDNCSCICHTQPGVMHVIACCGQGSILNKFAKPQEVKGPKFLSSETFAKYVASLPKLSRNINHFKYEFTFRRGEEPSCCWDNNGSDNLWLNERDVLVLTNRYEQLVTSINDLTNKQWTVENITFISAKGFSGATITLFDPAGKKFEYRYLNGGDPIDFIPLDLLDDLTNLHRRYERLKG